MAKQPTTLRISNPILLRFLEWLTEREQNKADLLREWVETGFSVWLMKTAILDPGLYAEIVGGTDDLAQAEELRNQGMDALRDTLQVLLAGIGGLGLQGNRSGAARRHDQAGDDQADDQADDDQADELNMFLDLADPTEML